VFDHNPSSSSFFFVFFFSSQIARNALPLCEENHERQPFFCRQVKSNSKEVINGCTDDEKVRAAGESGEVQSVDRTGSEAAPAGAAARGEDSRGVLPLQESPPRAPALHRSPALFPRRTLPQRLVWTGFGRMGEKRGYLDASRDRNSHGICNGKTQNLKYPMQEPPAICYKGQEASYSSSSATIIIREPKLPPPSPKQPTPSHSHAAQGYVLCPSACRSGSLGNFSLKPGARTAPPLALGSPNLLEYTICKPLGPQDASTQTDDRGSMSHESITRIVGVPTDDRPQNEQTMCSKEEHETNNVERSPPITLPSDPSCGKMNTLESLIRDEVSRRNNFRIAEAEEVFLPNRSKFKATNMLMHLITCGSTSVKDHYGVGFMPTYRTRFSDTNFSSPLSANSMVLGEINGSPESRREIGISLKKKGHFNGSMIEANKYKEAIGEGVPSLKRSSSFGEER
ncbi:hypothetical protein B296_00022714, partial [Ensete ventricosum]